ncbi:uncharacterized protein PFB0765w-like [Cynara cardunculus var. scolymus]|uniref:uncharacterized protein PFB0765w-like n=1 Tax=Cynara cardunculus var. scolymus TaxID=59895 RepID=UPI000D6266F2|nr:uncharacterized protein PFB0765w-like [Cynara cardunculus var. scolymus]
MAFVLERENKDLREKVYILENKFKKEQEKYLKIFYENHSNLCWAKDTIKKNQQIREEKKFLQAQIDELLARDRHYEIQDRNVELLKNNAELTTKVYEAEKALSSERRVFEKEKKKIVELEKLLESERKEFEKDKNKFSDAKQRFNVEKRIFESKLKSFEMSSVKLSEQIIDFEKIVIVERSKLKLKGKKSDKKCLEFSKSIVAIQKSLDDERKSFAIEIKNTAKKNATIAKE